MSNGKGSRARNNHSEQFRANFEAINWRRQAESTAKASKRAKSQGNSLSEAITASQNNPK
jgi:hypothetical protein